MSSPDKEVIWPIEAILDERTTRKGARQLLVQWGGLTTAGKRYKPEWLPVEDISPEIVAAWDNYEAGLDCADFILPTRPRVTERGAYGHPIGGPDPAWAAPRESNNPWPTLYDEYSGPNARLADPTEDMRIPVSSLVPHTMRAAIGTDQNTVPSARSPADVEMTDADQVEGVPFRHPPKITISGLAETSSHPDPIDTDMTSDEPRHQVPVSSHDRTSLATIIASVESRHKSSAPLQPTPCPLMPNLISGHCFDIEKPFRKVTHTNNVAPCQGPKHNPQTPHYVCVGCHNRWITSYLDQHEEDHMIRDRGTFPLCKPCAQVRIWTFDIPEGTNSNFCTCARDGDSWLCAECWTEWIKERTAKRIDEEHCICNSRLDGNMSLNVRVCSGCDCPVVKEKW